MQGPAPPAPQQSAPPVLQPRPWLGDPALDFLSEHFDAAKSLATPGLQVPSASAMPCWPALGWIGSFAAAVAAPLLCLRNACAAVSAIQCLLFVARGPHLLELSFTLRNTLQGLSTLSSVIILKLFSVLPCHAGADRD